MTEMKKTIYIAAIFMVSMSSCDLDLYPVTSYNEGNVTVEEEGGQYNTRADMLGLRDALYNSYVKDIQEAGYLDWLVYSECRADNAYCGVPSTGEIAMIEGNNVDAENKNVVRDWSYYMKQISNANQLICNIDHVMETDPALTQEEHDQWKAEALCWRAYNMYHMSLLWGEIPVVKNVPPAITADNIDDVYEEYFPTRASIEEVYAQIIEDLEFACKYAPDPNAGDGGNKYQFSKGFANGLLARVYATEPVLDWDKVATYCQNVENFGYRLCDNYRDLWAYDTGDAGENDTRDANRNTSESIFEVTWTRGQGNWIYMMFYRNYYNLWDSWSWAKWITPSRDIIEAYENEGDTERMNASIAWDQCSWSNYYSRYDYAFMNKCPTNASSTILMRLAEIYLLHAEALAMQGNFSADNGATYYVNLVRDRAKLPRVEAPADQESMIDIILKERRLELSFEGFRFFDLVRHGRAKEVHDRMPQEDSYWQTRYPLTEETILMPVPASEIDKNPELTQNPGY